MCPLWIIVQFYSSCISVFGAKWSHNLKNSWKCLMLSVSQFMSHKWGTSQHFPSPWTFFHATWNLSRPWKGCALFSLFLQWRPSTYDGLCHLLHRFSCFSTVLWAYIVYVARDVFCTSLGVLVWGLNHDIGTEACYGLTKARLSSATNNGSCIHICLGTFLWVTLCRAQKFVSTLNGNIYTWRSRITQESCPFGYLRVCRNFPISARQANNQQSSTELCSISNAFSLSTPVLFIMTHFLAFFFSYSKSKHFDTLPFVNTVCQKIYKDGKSCFLLSNLCRQLDHFHP